MKRDPATDPLSFIIAAEEAPELMEAQEFVEGVARLVRSGIIRSLQGSWQRTAMNLIETGVIDVAGNVNQDALDEMMEAV